MLSSTLSGNKHIWLRTVGWSRIAEKMRKFNAVVPDEYEADDPTREMSRKAAETKELSDAMLVGSRISGEGDDSKHVVALDLDMHAILVPSSTAGHYHLYIDHEMSWPTYEKLLDALGEAGIIEPGYVTVSKRRKETHLRTPWVNK